MKFNVKMIFTKSCQNGCKNEGYNFCSHFSSYLHKLQNTFTVHPQMFPYSGEMIWWDIFTLRLPV